MNETRPYRSAYGYIRSSVPGLRLRAAVLEQSRRINAFCSNGLHVLSSTVVELEAAGNQPHLDRLLDQATSPDHPFDLLIVTSESRLSRDPAMLQQITRLAAAGVALAVLDTVQAPAAAATMAVEIL